MPSPRSSLHPVWPTVRAVALTVVPEAHGLDEGGWRELRRVMEDALDRRPSRVVRQLRALVTLVQWLPVLRYGRSFRSLDAARRERFLRSLQDSSLVLLRRGFWGLRTLVLMGYYGRSAAAEEIGYRAGFRGWAAPW